MLRCPAYIFLFIFGYLKTVFSLGDFMGPADFQFQLIEDCKNVDELRGIDINLSQKKYNRTTHVIDIEIDSTYDLDDAIIMELTVYMKNNGGYTQSLYWMKPMCEALRRIMGDMFFDFLKATAGIDDCPLPEGTYLAENLLMDTRKYTVPQVYGEYKAEFRILKEGELIRCFNVLYELVPKET